jgi:hypothetical protein
MKTSSLLFWLVIGGWLETQLAGLRAAERATNYFDLVVSGSPGGTIQVDPPIGPFPQGAIVHLIARPAPGWSFLEWHGDIEGTTGVPFVEMNGDKRVEGVFGTTLAVESIGPGVVSAEPDAAFYPWGTSVRLAAKPQPGYALAFWQGLLPARADSEVPLLITNAQPSVRAVFEALDPKTQVSFALRTSGHGRVETTPSGSSFAPGRVIRLAALPDEGQAFIRWTGDVTGSENPLLLTLDGSKSVVAEFSARPTLRAAATDRQRLETPVMLTLDGDFAGRYQIERSADLVAWEPVSTVTSRYGHTEVAVAVGSLQAAFFRAKTLDSATPRVGVEWVNEYHNIMGKETLTYRDQCAGGFYTALVNGPALWKGAFNVGNEKAWEKHFKKQQLGGIDYQWADAVDFAYFAGHGAHNTGFGTGGGFTFGVNANDDWVLACVPGTREPRWGDGSLRWIVLDVCAALAVHQWGDTSANEPPLYELWDRWANSEVMAGLHFIFGFRTEAYDSGDRGKLFADFITGTGVSQKYPVRIAWRYATVNSEWSDHISASLYAASPGADPGNESIFGYGTVSKDPNPVNQIYYISSWPCHF